MPEVSSERRTYLPIGFLDASVIASNLLFIIPNATLYHFGILTSIFHMAWVRVVAGRLKSDYRYSKDIVYNNFPWPNPTKKQKAAIEKTAAGILAAREKYPDKSLAQLYAGDIDEKEFGWLKKAHAANDSAVRKAYGFKDEIEEVEIVAKLMKMYEELVGKI